jgi:hypothetical protein
MAAGARGQWIRHADESINDLENYLPSGARIPMRPEADAFFRERVQSLGAADRRAGACHMESQTPC